MWKLLEADWKYQALFFDPYIHLLCLLFMAYDPLSDHVFM